MIVHGRNCINLYMHIYVLVISPWYSLYHSLRKLYCTNLLGLIRQPKYDHLKELHRAIKMCEQALVSADPIVTSLGSSQQVLISILKPSCFWQCVISNVHWLKSIFVIVQAYVYSSKSGHCAAFLANYETKSAARVMFNNKHYNVPPWSISVLPDCRNVVFNTAKVWNFI